MEVDKPVEASWSKEMESFDIAVTFLPHSFFFLVKILDVPFDWLCLCQIVEYCLQNSS